MVKLLSGRPNASNKVLEEDGTFTYTWYLFMIQVWEKLGGSEDRVDDATPTGMISGFGGITAPTGWLFCDGSAVNRAAFQNLFDVIGVTYGVGDGSTTFNLPDGQGRTLVGAGTGPSLTPRSRGDEFGEETHTQTIDEMPIHNHPLTDPEHDHPTTESPHLHNNATGNFVNDAAGTEYLNTGGDKGTVNASTATSSTGLTVDAAATGITLADTGSGDAFNVLGPSWVANFMIKT